jgi:hypothetical protein
MFRMKSDFEDPPPFEAGAFFAPGVFVAGAFLAAVFAFEAGFEVAIARTLDTFFALVS